jgi:hypothetical protein
MHVYGATAASQECPPPLPKARDGAGVGSRRFYVTLRAWSVLQGIDQQGPVEAQNETLLVEAEKGKENYARRGGLLVWLWVSGGGGVKVGGYMTGSVSGSRPSTLRLIEKNLE